MKSSARKKNSRKLRAVQSDPIETNGEPLETPFERHLGAVDLGPLEPLEPRGDQNDGTLRQHLDMIEPGVGPWQGEGPRGDDVEHRIPHPSRPVDSDPLPFDAVLNRWEMTLSEDNREGDEMSGDEHSIGQQGDDPNQPQS